VELIECGENLGFAGGTNVGIRNALSVPDCEFIICLNNDTVAHPGWLAGLVGAVDYDNRFDMISSKALFPDGKVQTIGLAYSSDLMGAFKGGLSVGYDRADDMYQAPAEVFAPSGVSCLLTRRLLTEVGLFDEDFFAYGEDLDLGMRARAKGFRCKFAPDSVVTHFHSRTSGGASSPMKAYFIKRNNYFVAAKNFDLPTLILFPLRDWIWNVRAVFYRGGGGSVAALGKHHGSSWAMLTALRAYVDGVLGFPRMIAKRLKRQKY